MSLFKNLACVRGHTIWTKDLGPESVVVDAGAHRGEFSRTLVERYRCRCYLVEANPTLSAKLTDSRFSGVANVALGATDSTARFIMRDNPESSSLIPRATDGQTEATDVDVVSLPTLMRHMGLPQIDLLKLDIEGDEFNLIENTPVHILRSIGQITVEFHDFLPEFSRKGLFGRAKTRLKVMGFVCCPMSFRTHGDVLFLNRRAAYLDAGAYWKLSAFSRWVMKLRKLKTAYARDGQQSKVPCS